jgi:hypothetical protein
VTLPLGPALVQAQSPGATPRAILELRYYHLRSGRQVEKTTTYLQHGLFPALERAAIRPTGCFSAVIAPDAPFLLTLISYPSLTALDAGREKLAVDKELQKAADDWDAGGELGYIRMESSLLWSFSSLPSVMVPPPLEGRAARLFELRTYEAANETRLGQKIKGFGQGEFDIFRRCHLLPVFGGQTIFGTHMPSLTYMLGFDDWAARDRGWAAFNADPDWQKVRATMDSDVVTNTSNPILRPTAFSGIR